MNFLKKIFGGREDKQMNFGIYNYLGEEVQGMAQMKDAIAQWDRLYKNNADWIYGDTKSLNLAAGIASELYRHRQPSLKSRYQSYCQATPQPPEPYPENSLPQPCAKRN